MILWKNWNFEIFVSLNQNILLSVSDENLEILKEVDSDSWMYSEVTFWIQIGLFTGE